MLARFQLQKYRSDTRTEVIGGITSFLATFYIVIVNPAILSAAGLPFAAVSTATILIAAFSTILMGFYANTPIVLAPGMGLNAFFTYAVVKGMGVPPDVALGIVCWSGVIFIVLSLLKVREWIVFLIPPAIRHAVACGIGLFIAFIGFINGGIVEKNPVTLVQMAELGPLALTFFAGLLITVLLLIRRVPGALVLGMIATLVLSLPIGRLYGDASGITNGSAVMVQWQGVFAAPDFSLFLHADLIGSLQLAFLPVMLAFLFTDLFDTISTLVGVSEAGDLLDERGEPRNLRKALLVDAIATTGSGLLGSSPTTSYIESAAGVQQGARTGLAAVVAGLCFLPLLFFAPLLSMFPQFVAAPVLVLVGVFMLHPIRKIDWQRLEVAVPAFLALILIPLTFSITKGIVAGLVSYGLLALFTGDSGSPLKKRNADRR